MSAHPLLPDPACLTLERIRIENGVILFAARTVAASATCPCCGHSSERVHSRYRRVLLDLPWQGNAVRVVLTVRRFFCDNRNCARRIFAERLSQVAQRYARKTCRLAEALRELAFLAGGEAAARIARTFGLLVSPDALLYNLRRFPKSPAPTPCVLGVDDFAFRRGHRYGTILVDLEKHCPVDLLPDRDSDTLSRWLKEHPGVEFVSRDRADSYRNGITAGAPEAAQVADRWHLLKNMGDILERYLLRHHKHLALAARELLERSLQAEAQQAGSSEASQDEETNRLTRAQQQKTHRRQRRQERYERVRELHAQGFTQKAISIQTGLDRKTIRKYLNAPSCPFYPKRRSRRGGSLLAPFHAYLKQRWDEGCHNAALLFEEIRALGYRGRDTILRSYLQPFRARLPEEKRCSTTGPKPRSLLPGSGGRRTTPTPAMVRWWLLGHFTAADAQEQAWQRDFLEALIRLCPEIGDVQQQAVEFGQIVKERQESAFDAWLAAVEACTVPELRSFARGLLQDEAAVRAALSVHWSNGQTEGQVNRLKFIKRPMYGRGSFDLLRARVLYQSAA